MSMSDRMEILTKRLRGRTTRTGEALPGFKSNVASIRAEIAELQEKLESGNGNS